MSAIACMKCPQCGQTEKFKIAVLAWADVEQNGVTDLHDIEWDEPDACVCPACQYAGTVKDFHEQQVSTVPNILNG